MFAEESFVSMQYEGLVGQETDQRVRGSMTNNGKLLRRTGNCMTPVLSSVKLESTAQLTCAQKNAGCLEE